MADAAPAVARAAADRAPAAAPTAPRACAAGAASAGPAAGSRATCPTPTTPRSGSPGGCPTAGSTTSTSPSTARRSPSSAPSSGVDAGTDAAEAEGRISRFRAETREQRIAIAQEAQGRYQRTVSWGARVGGATALFTHLAVPVMTRLRQPERAVLDTLVDAGVARSRSDALAWSVRVVGEHADTWLAELREKMSEVDKLRAKGPEL